MVGHGGTGKTSHTLGSILVGNGSNQIQELAPSPSKIVTFDATGAPALESVLSVEMGGTGLDSIPAVGEIDIGNGAGFTRTTLTAGVGVSILSEPGKVTISSPNVDQVLGTSS